MSGYVSVCFRLLGLKHNVSFIEDLFAPMHMKPIKKHFLPGSTDNFILHSKALLRVAISSAIY
jgi:hypothetical protein